MLKAEDTPDGAGAGQAAFRATAREGEHSTVRSPQKLFNIPTWSQSNGKPTVRAAAEARSFLMAVAAAAAATATALAANT